ncbi:hypothetical protein DYB32_008669 [Aphanomyces invadans]|uniref:HTH CENPB-type domain-containing protein n=1 Tax=Aphanomyces invadans TaxID=157072 RepID=A0A418AKH4_9STRA|nr:hypothetical protein DYB32_008669 [Aphanomyces invadans]
MRLPSKPSASAMSRVVRQRLDPNTLASRPKLKSRKPVHCPRLESDLVEWLRECETFGINVTYQAIKEYAAQLCCTYDDNVKLLFSHGWTSKFLAHWRMGRKGVHGQALSVDKSVVEDCRAALQALTATYERCDVYKFGETAYFYSQEPKFTIASKNVTGQKDIKNRLTVAAAVNADGSDALDLKIIGRSARPRWFGARTTTDMNIDYSSSSKGWVTSSIFGEWLKTFNVSIVAQDRKVHLLLDNASSHKLPETLSNVNVRFLPPNTTAYLQPLDAGVIAALRKKIQRRKTKYVLTKFEEICRFHKAAGTVPSRQEIAEMHKVDM